jgi:putative colanic acid biosynthesis acetyltransferase WcaF
MTSEVPFEFPATSGPRVLSLRQAPGEREAWDKPKFYVYVWALAELLFVTNPLQISSTLRIAVLRWFGADIGKGVIFRPRTRVKFPWKLHVADDCWIGEGVWFHNQDHIHVGHDVVISQETFLTTGTHALRRDMALLTRPIHISPGAWIASRCVILGGAFVGRSAVLAPLTVAKGAIAANTVVSGPDAQFVAFRFPEGQD